MDVLDLFSAAAGGWSLGMHRAGFRTVAACEAIAWRRALYAENNQGVPIYDDVCTLTADRILADLGYFPDVVVGSPPCQDVSPANTKGKGVEGERSGLFFEAVRIIGEGRPRWFALENSANLRTRGADAVLAALEAIGYTCWPFVVRAGDIGANHERGRSWLIGCDLEQVADAHGVRWDGGREGWRGGIDLSFQDGPVDAAGIRYEGGRPRRHGPHGLGPASVAASDALGSGRLRSDADDQRSDLLPRNAPDTDQEGQEDGCLVAGLRQAEISNDGRSARRSDDGSITRQMGICEADRLTAFQHRADWSLDDLAGHLRLDDGLSAWVAGTRIAVGGPRGTSAASLIVEAFGDAVVPQIPEAIGRAILRTEAALSAVYSRAAA